MFDKLFSKIMLFIRCEKKNVTAGQGTDNSMAQALLCWITKATNTHSEYVVLTASLLQQWLHDRALMLRYMYIVCVVAFVIVRL